MQQSSRRKYLEDTIKDYTNIVSEIYIYVYIWSNFSLEFIIIEQYCIVYTSKFKVSIVKLN